MKSFAVAAAFAGVAVALPQTYTPSGTFSSILPSSTAGSDCQTTYPGTFEIQIVNQTSSSKVKRDSTALSISLQNGVLTDAKGRIGYIASNDQFQFDFGGQAGEKYTAGWAVCNNGTLALGADAIFYKCLSGTFYNLYDENTSAQCSPVYIEVINASGSTSAAATSAAATQLSDGQVTASPAAPVTQITDGQVQATTGLPVTQISDGQIQATTGVPVTQISDGQIQVPTSTGAAVTQISDGQIQAATTVSPVTQISDGQIQAATGSAVTPITQISDGQIQASATNGTKPTSASATVVAYTGAAALPSMRAELFGLAAGVMAVAFL